MMRRRLFPQLAILLACFGLLAPAGVSADEPANPLRQIQSGVAQNASSLVRDVALDRRGALRGQIMNRSGAPLAEMRISIRRQGQTVAVARSDAQGRFEVTGVTPGLYEIETPLGGCALRLWSPDAAPPAARSGALIVADAADVVRGQLGMPGPVSALASPWTMGLIAAAAIAIPVTVDNAPASN